MWEQEHRERSSYRQHENHCACYQSIREEHRHKLVQLILKRLYVGTGTSGT